MALQLFDSLGGRKTLDRVHKVFYDKIYIHPWLKHYFKGIDQTLIEKQQTEFMIGAMGGPKIYSGRLPTPAHKHMNITDELFEVRHQLLKQSMQECGVPPDLAAQWLKMDYAFKKSLVKKSIGECEKRYPSDTILNFNKP